MGRPSKFKRLPPEIQAEVERLRIAGRTIDEIMAALQAMDLAPDALPSRSGMGAQMKSIDAMVEFARQGRIRTVTWNKETADPLQGGSQARASIEMMHAINMQVMIGAIEDGVKLSASECKALSASINATTRAESIDLDTRLKIKAEMAAEMEKKLTALGAEVAEEKVPPSPAEMLARIRALYAGEG